MEQNVIIKNLRNRGASMIEYAVLIVVVVVFLLGMRVYLTRAVQGKWKQSADSLGYGLQYQPGEGGTKIHGSLGGD